MKSTFNKIKTKFKLIKANFSKRETKNIIDENYRKNVFPYLPQYSPTNFSINLGAAACNHSCLFCPQSITKPSNSVWLELDLLEKVLKEMPQKGILLNISAYTETLSAPNLVDAVKIMKTLRPKLPIVMATNGSLFVEKKIKELLKLGLDHYSYSFDAPTKDSYARLMQIDHFERVDENFKRLIKLRDSLSAKTKITTHIMKFKETEKFFDQFKKDREKLINRKLGDDILLRPVGNWGGESWGLDKNLNKAGFSYEKEKIPKKRYPCSSIFMHFKLQHTGLYAPCVTAVPDTAIENELHTCEYIGDAREISWSEAWDKLNLMRLKHLNGDWNPIEACKTCNIWSLWENTFEKSNSGKFSH